MFYYYRVSEPGWFSVCLYFESRPIYVRLNDFTRFATLNNFNDWTEVSL